MFPDCQTMFPSEKLFAALSCCHSISQLKGHFIGDPLDIKMFDSTDSKFDDSEVTEGNIKFISTIKCKQSMYGVVRRFEFSSKL
mmetsp:Transcript_15332/g.13060  ORF Transcript_15332/g.13060 Transcript_15332/m.13060 type:complete len:84 (+) Transcript_15332:1551-1802(+)